MEPLVIIGSVFPEGPLVGTRLEKGDQKKPWSLDNPIEFSVEGMP